VAADGLITLRSNYAPKETMNRLETEVKAKGLAVFARSILDVALDEDFSIRLLSARAHYMRGPGPKWREKHASARFTSYTGQLSAVVPAPPVALRDLTPWLGI
jgi:hypothetical protein